MAKKFEIRKLYNGDTVVDFGVEWFRIRRDGSAVKKWAEKGAVHSMAATPAERKKIFAIAFPIALPSAHHSPTAGEQ